MAEVTADTTVALPRAGTASSASGTEARAGSVAKKPVAGVDRDTLLDVSLVSSEAPTSRASESESSTISAGAVSSMLNDNSKSLSPTAHPFAPAGVDKTGDTEQDSATSAADATAVLVQQQPAPARAAVASNAKDPAISKPLVLVSLPFWLLVLQFFILQAVGGGFFLGNLGNLAGSMGFTTAGTTKAVVIVSLSSAIGRLLIGFVMDFAFASRYKICRSRFLLIGAICYGTAIFLVCKNG